MNYKIMIEGQEIPVPEEIGKDDDSVKRALTPFYPEVANAMITRVATDDTTTVTVVKRAGTKGARNPLEKLAACKGGKNPAVELYDRLENGDQTFDPLAMMEIEEQIDKAIEAGETQAAMVVHAFKRLANAAPQPAAELVSGF